MAITQLGLWNHALRLVGERPIASVVEDREPARELSNCHSEVVQHCLESGMWNFCMRDRVMTQNGAGSMGRTYIFTKPTDFLQLFLASDTEPYNTQLLNDLIDQGGSLYADASQIFIRYTSNNGDFGLDLTKWPNVFGFYVAACLASQICVRLTSSPEMARHITEIENMRYLNALDICAVKQRPGMYPMNIEARNPARNDAPHGAASVMPFGKYLNPPPKQSGGRQE